MHASKAFLTDYLREELGFDGLALDTAGPFTFELQSLRIIPQAGVETRRQTGSWRLSSGRARSLRLRFGLTEARPAWWGLRPRLLRQVD